MRHSAAYVELTVVPIVAVLPGDSRAFLTYILIEGRIPSQPPHVQLLVRI